MAFIDVKLSQLFISKRGLSKYSKAYMNVHQGPYPVYTGATENGGVGGYVDDYNEMSPLLTFANTGEKAGIATVIRDEKYSVGPNRTKLICIAKNICLEYICYVIQPVLFANRKVTSTYTLVWNDVKELTIPIPILNNGEYDIEEQQRLAGRYEYIDELKARIKDSTDEILNTVPQIHYDKIRFVKINEIFDIDKSGGKSLYTKSYCKQHFGNIPVYASSSTEPLGFVDKADFDGKYLTWARNGLAGYISVINGLFCINADRGILIPYSDIKSLLDIEYLKYVIEPFFRANIKGRIGDKGKNEYTKLHPSMIRNIEIPIPISVDGTYDLIKQKEIALQYKHVDKLKEDLKKRLDVIMDVSVIID